MVSGSSLFAEIENYLGIPQSTLARYANQGRISFYRHVRIPKEKGGYRDLYLPTAELKVIQHFLVEKYLSHIPVSNHAKAYLPGSSTINNAAEHRLNCHFLFMDVHDFFDTIPFDRLCGVLMATDLGKHLDQNDVRNILRLCSYHSKFVQGCVSSPALSNIYLRDFDHRMESLVREFPNGVYTRYSDDIVISSTEKIPQSMVETITALLREYGLQVNSKKTKFISNMDNVSVTGVRITHDHRMVLSTKFKKDLKFRIYRFLNKNERTLLNKNYLLGSLGYLKTADPYYFNKINYKYRSDKQLLMDRIKSAPVREPDLPSQ